MKRAHLIIISILVLMLSSSFQKNENMEKEGGYIPKVGMVPNAETAIKIAEAILVPIYGERVLDNRPFVAKLEDGVWYVEGTLPIECVGGVPYVELQKSDCKILSVIHTK